MKILLLIFIILLKNSDQTILTSISNGFQTLKNDVTSGINTLVNSHPLTSLENSIDTKFGNLKTDVETTLGLNSTVAQTTVLDDLNLYTNHQSLLKTKLSENAIANILSDNGELNDNVLNNLIYLDNQKNLEQDYHMGVCRGSVQEIIKAFDPLTSMETELKYYTDPTNRQETVTGGTQINKQIYTTITQIYAQRTILKKDLLVLSQNIDYLKRSDFDISTFYFRAGYSAEEEYIVSRTSSQSDILYNIYSSQKDVFENRISEMQVIYEQFNHDLAQIFEICDTIYTYFLERQRRAELVTNYPGELQTQLNQLFHLRRDFAEKVLIFQVDLDRVEGQRSIFDTIFISTQNIEDVGNQADEIKQILIDQTKFTIHFTPTQQATLITLQQEAKDDRQQLIEYLNEELQDNSDPALTSEQKSDRKKVRDSNKNLIVQRIEERETEIDAIEQSLKDANSSVAQSSSTANDQMSAEDFFKMRDQQIARLSLVQNLKAKINSNTITMADVQDKQLADEIATQSLNDAKANVALSRKSVTTATSTPSLNDSIKTSSDVALTDSSPLQNSPDQIAATGENPDLSSTGNRKLLGVILGNSGIIKGILISALIIVFCR